MSGINSGMNVSGGPKLDVKKVDQAQVLPGKNAAPAGSRKGSVDASMSKIANPPGPRDPVRQYPLSGKQAASGKSESTANYEGVGG